MRNIITAVFSFVLLNGVTELHQLLKLPLLISHFRHHQSEDPSISLFEFIQLHYTADQHPDDNDSSEDNNLPFKSTETIQHMDVLISSQKNINTAVPFIVKCNNCIFHPEGLLNRRSFSVFHPPRMP